MKWWRRLLGPVPEAPRPVRPSYAYHFREGDLGQLAAQEEFLRQRGLAIVRQGPYPAVTCQEEYEQGLRLIWRHQVDGWWMYREDFLKKGICTAEQFGQAFSREYARSR